MKEKKNGMTVKVTFKKGVCWAKYEDEVEQTYNNVTQVHFGYEGAIGGRNKVAFESDIHGTGCTEIITDILEMEVTPATKIEEHF